MKKILIALYELGENVDDQRIADIVQAILKYTSIMQRYSRIHLKNELQYVGYRKARISVEFATDFEQQLYNEHEVDVAKECLQPHLDDGSLVEFYKETIKLQRP